MIAIDQNRQSLIQKFNNLFKFISTKKMTESLKDIKKNLEKALGPEDFGKYLKLLKKWFTENLTKEQFDTHARKLISRDKIHYHNELFVAILSKCNVQYAFGGSSIPSSSSSAASTAGGGQPRKRKSFEVLKQILAKSNNNKPEKRFRTSEPIQTSSSSAVPSQQSIIGTNKSNGHAQTQQQSIAGAPRESPQLPTGLGDNLTVCIKDGLLPDRSLMNGRALVIAWELGMDDVEEESVDLVVLAARDLLKNVLHTAIQLRRNFVVTNSGLPHLFGVDASITTSAASRPSNNQAIEIRSAQLIDASRTKPIGPIRLRDIYDGLKLRPDILPCKTVKTVVLERVLCKLGDDGDQLAKKIEDDLTTRECGDQDGKVERVQSAINGNRFNGKCSNHP